MLYANYVGHFTDVHVHIYKEPDHTLKPQNILIPTSYDVISPCMHIFNNNLGRDLGGLSNRFCLSAAKSEKLSWYTEW